MIWVAKNLYFFNCLLDGAHTTKDQKITATASYTKTETSKAFKLNAKTNGNGKLTYQTSDKSVVAVDANGKVTVKAPGKATITVKAAATDTYKAATKKITITVAPKKQRIALNNKKAAQLTVKWDKNKKVSGYEFVYADNKNFKKAKTVRKSNATTYTVKKLKTGKTYYVKARAYKTVAGKQIYGAFSSVKKATIK
ncbi:MAG: fibronectin type III domain-containing protein [Dorea sp.]|nr:fibronectin type III domain-containing protein [Dorea sp.]